MPSPDAEPLEVPALLRIGASRRDGALSTQSARSITGFIPPTAVVWDVDLRDARHCYQSALELSPNNYEANMGLGIVYLVAGQRESHPGRANVRASFLAASRRHLGTAYFGRQAPHDPLYYLAVVAVLENDFPKAQYLAEILIRDDVKAAEAHTLLGYILELQGNRGAAVAQYDQALLKGGAVETLEFVMYHRERNR